MLKQPTLTDTTLDRNDCLSLNSLISTRRFRSISGASSCRDFVSYLRSLEIWKLALGDIRFSLYLVGAAALPSWRVEDFVKFIRFMAGLL